jgi:carboxypeptidase Q
MGQKAEDSVLIRHLADTILTDGKTYGDLKLLTKGVGARLSGSAGYYKAEVWGQKALTDAKAENVRLQECMVPHWVRGGRDSASFAWGGMYSNKNIHGQLDILALGNSVGTGPAGISAQVVLIHDFAELERKKDSVKGKIVFYNYKFNPHFIETFMAYGDAVRYRGFGASRAAKYGAVAMMTRSMSASVDNNPHTGALIYNDSFPKIPAVAIMSSAS